MNIVWECEEVLEKDWVGTHCVYELKIFKPVIKKKKHLYVGVDGKYPDGTYQTSIRNKEASLELYADLMQYEHEWRIIATGSELEMYALEKQILDDVDAAKNPEYYNSSRSNGYKTDAAFLEVEENFFADEYEVTVEDWETVLNMDTIQVRPEAWIPDHVKKLVRKINDSNAKWLEDNDKPVLTLRDFYGPGRHCRIGKRNTIEAIKKTKYQPDLKVMWVPMEDWSQLAYDEIVTLGQYDNPKDANPRAEQDDTSIRDNLVAYCKRTGKDHTDPIIVRKLEKLGFGQGEIKGMKIKIKNQMTKPSNLAPGEVFVPMDDAQATAYASNLRKENTFALSVSSGRLGKVFEKFVEALKHKEALNATSWIIYVYHPTELAFANWPSKQKEFETNVKNLEKFAEGYDKNGKIVRKQFFVRQSDQIELQV